MNSVLVVVQYGLYLQREAMLVKVNGICKEEVTEDFLGDLACEVGYPAAYELAEGWVGSNGFCEDDEGEPLEDYHEEIEGSVEYSAEVYNPDEHDGLGYHGEGLEVEQEITVKPTKIYAENAEQSALDQFESAMSQDFAVKGALMPDAHKGYSLPIGGVVATKDAIVPAWVGYDIGCGMCAVKTNLKLENIKDRELREDIQKAIFVHIPVGFNRHKTDVFWTKPAHTRVAEDIFNEHQGSRQLGTLGGGNHFIEIGYDEEGCVWVTIHSGSRGIGWKIAEYYMKVAAGSDKAEEGHHALRVGTEEAKNYIGDLNFALEFALANRNWMMNTVLQVLYDYVNKQVEVLEFINRNHNHAEFKDGLWIHRKGATHAEKGMRGIIPGCSRDGVFIVTGKGNPDSLCSSSHGAGRVLGRYKAKKVLDFDKYEEDMKDIVGVVSKNTLDESAGAYKNIFEVMELQKDLVEVTHYIKPLISVKDGK